MHALKLAGVWFGSLGLIGGMLWYGAQVNAGGTDLDDEIGARIDSAIARHVSVAHGTGTPTGTGTGAGTPTGTGTGTGSGTGFGTGTGNLPPPPPPVGEILYANDFQGADPFAGWRGRNVSSNLTIHTELGNRYARLDYNPNSDWRISFLPRNAGAFDLRVAFAYRLPKGIDDRRNDEGGIIGGGKHVWQMSNVNTFADGRNAIANDGWTRLDFGSPAGVTGWWDCVSFRWPPHSRERELKHKFQQTEWFLKERWYSVRADFHINQQRGEDGTVDLWIDGDHKGTFEAEFNVIGGTGGLRVLGFGNYDNLIGEPWVEVDDIRVEAL